MGPSLTAKITAQNITLTARAAIGSHAQNINIVSTGVLTATADTLSIDPAAGIDFNIYITAVSGDVALNTVSTAVSAFAFITANVGNIFNGRSDNSPNVLAGSADLIANQSIGKATKRIVSTVGKIEAASTHGDIYLWNIGALTVGGVVPVAATPFPMYAPNGSINIQTSSPVDVILSNFSSGNILYQAGTASASDDNLTVHSGVTLDSTGGSVELDAGNNLTVQAGAVIEAGGPASPYPRQLSAAHCHVPHHGLQSGSRRLVHRAHPHGADRRRQRRHRAASRRTGRQHVRRDRRRRRPDPTSTRCLSHHGRQ